MKDHSTPATNIPPEQEAIRAKCFHPTGTFVEFKNEEIDQSIPQRFEKIVAKDPDRLAIKTKTHSVTYAELNRLANRVARAIIARQESGDKRIALLFENDAPMIAAILGVLKAGMIYVPLDPLFPNVRNTYIAKNSQAGLIVTSNKNLLLAKELANDALPLLNIEEFHANLSTQDLSLSISPDSPAYILYTSGSTGTPKGVLQIHHNVLHDIMQYTNTLHICPDDRMTLLYSYSVNGAVRGIFGALLNGATLYPLDIRHEGMTGLLKLLSTEGITFYHSVPTVFRNFVSTLTGNETFPSLRLIRFAGERVLARDVELYKKHFPDSCFLYTGMGSTETGHVCQYFIDKQTQLLGSVVPTGYQVEDKQIFLLDDVGQQVGFDCPGEIAVKSQYLFPGYWRNPDLTRAAFLKDPEGGSERIFRTGDLGRMMPDGCLEHLGRKDFQAKVRGYRVEISEVEIALLKLPSVKEAVVVAREDQPGDKRLIAYLVPKEQFAPSTSELRSFLATRVPDYMLPSSFVILDTMPLTPNGKVDRRALPPPDQSRPNLTELFVAPRSPVEEMVANTWSNLLAIRHVGIHDNFFSLGGHSLVATRVISRLREALKLELPLRALFENPTVADLAAYLDREVQKQQSPRALPIQPVTRDKNLPLSFAQQRLWFLDQLEPGAITYNMARAVRVSGQLDVSALQRSLDEILRRHEVLRTTFPVVDDQPVQLIGPLLPCALSKTDLRTVPEGERLAEAQSLIKKAICRPFDLAKGPLFRAMLIQLAEDDYIFLYAPHHIVFDGWSIGICEHELWTLYQAFSKGDPSPLPKLPIQYADFAHWHRQLLQGEVLEKQLTYWKQQLGESLSVLKLSTDRPRPAIQGFRGARQSLVLSKDETESLKALSRQEGVTLFMTVLAAFQILLKSSTGQDDIVVGTDVANRNRVEIEGMIGLFVNQLVLRGNLSGNPTFRGLLARVREMILDSYAHQDLPFDKLVQELRPERDMSRNPLFQVMFVFQNVPRPVLQAPGLTLSPVEIDTQSAPFDLSLQIQEIPEGLSCGFRYNTDLFDAATISHMAERFEVLQRSISSQPDARVDALTKIFTETERQKRIEMENALEKARFQKFKTVRRKAVDQSHLKA